jgi:hypothetical protein
MFRKKGLVLSDICGLPIFKWFQSDYEKDPHIFADKDLYEKLIARSDSTVPVGSRT